ncbi:hypothetical protein NP493_2165g00006 [Ridgeia piscesae]|uniref:Galaxin-like repeats domain-containing protein n=1 Tax=Ridgeia piscesae TaxID=27915 RepID=A0AAD9JM66_RIDPI|nr:hypothetical protein NP493_2165g00006 [Ridgeia piscesae]
MTNCVVLAVLLVLVVQHGSCFLFVPTKCGGKEFDRETHICCRGQLYKLSKEWQVFCCVDRLYRPDLQHCCYQNRTTAKIVDIDPEVPRWVTCSKVRETSSDE